jgi:hypothetical protein
LTSITLTDFIVDLVYEKFPDDASSVGDGAIRGLASSEVDLVGSVDGYRFDVGNSIRNISALVTIVKFAYDLYCRHRALDQSQIFVRVHTDLRNKSQEPQAEPDEVPEPLDDETVEFIVRRTVEYARRQT